MQIILWGLYGVCYKMLYMFGESVFVCALRTWGGVRERILRKEADVRGLVGFGCCALSLLKFNGFRDGFCRML